MEVTVEKSSELKRKLTVKMPSNELQAKIDARLTDIGKTLKLKGFRPGKIPRKILHQRYGKSVQREVVSELIQSSLYKAIEKEKLRPASNPVLDNLPDLGAAEQFEFTASIEVYPEIGAIDVSRIELTRPQAEVTEADVDEMLETLQKQRQTWEDIDSAPVEGNQVVVEYTAETDSGTVPSKGRQRLSLVLGTSGFTDLEKLVTGMKPGDTRDSRLQFPEAYGDAQLAGKEAQVALEVKLVQKAELPEIDAAFIRSFAIESGSIEDMRKEVRGNLERELDQATKTFLKTQLVRKLMEKFKDLEVPESIVKQETASLQKRAAGSQGVDVAQIPRGPYEELAKKRVRSGLLLAELSRQNNIMIDGARVRKTIETVAETYDQPREVVQMYYGNQQLLQSIENLVLEEQVVDWVMEQAKVTDKASTFREVINSAAAAAKD